MKLSLETCAEWMGGELSPAAGAIASQVVGGYSIDSRTVGVGQLFFAVSGERYDAHRFVADALSRGAAAAVVALGKVDGSGESAPGMPLIFTDKQIDKPVDKQIDKPIDKPVDNSIDNPVDGPLLALQRLGAAVRRHWGGTLIGLTGSAGKTTTKEMVAAVLSAKYNVLKSAGNLNNHFGVPLQLLRLEPEHRFAVIEMGMSGAGEIALLAGLAAPDWGVVTNVGVAHAGNFADGVEGIALAKRELIDALSPERGVAFLNADDPRVAGYAASFGGRVVLVGRGEAAEVRAVAIEERGTEGSRMRVRAGGKEEWVQLRFLGGHNASNALLALAVGVEAGVSLETGATALAGLAPGEKRGELLQVRGAQVINDCYNSNPAALSAMIETLMRVPAERHILIAGEMLELGPETGALHAEAGEQAARAGVDWVVGVQGAALALAEEAAKLGVQALFLANAEEAGAWLGRELRAGDAVLVKGSRGVRLERALAGIEPG
jgi:UDP-N-acetylmuramoyl-tripeptide--D-alanyl-D-alanine ligase